MSNNTETLAIITLPTGENFPLGTDKILIGRNQQCDIRLEKDLSCSREQLSIEYKSGQFILTPLSTSSPTYINKQITTKPRKLKMGDVIKFGSSQLVLKNPSGKLNAQQAVQTGTHDTNTALNTKELQLKKHTIIGRAADQVNIHLDHLSVSRKHAEIKYRAKQLWIKDLGSSNGTFINGTQIKGVTQLNPGDRIDIGPYSLNLSGNTQVAQASSRDKNCHLLANNLIRIVGQFNKKKTILSDISIALEPKEFVCLLGPSGSGKSTLMNAISARYPASKGSVWLNGLDLYKNFSSLKESISLVPQQDVLYEQLTLKESLYYTAKLRLPKDLSKQDIDQVIHSTLSNVELTEHVGTKIKDLSGGQQKRASLANEIICKPSLLFLDEVTSGLDEATDWEMMQLFRNLASQGLLVICVTHTLANVEEFCHKVVVMAEPGVLAFYGTPADAKKYFSVKKLGDVYRVLPKKNGDQWRTMFENSQYFRPLPPLPNNVQAESKNTKTKIKSPSAGFSEVFRQFYILTKRNLRLLFKSKEIIGIAILQSALIGMLLSMVFGTLQEGHPSEFSLVFLLGICSFWLGCSGAAKEIVKERTIYLRELDVKLSVFAYILSKSLVFGLFATLQVAILYSVFDTLSRVPGEKEIQFLQMVIAGLTGTSLGMLISASCSNQEQANTIVPLALIPQIVLAGVIVQDLPEIPEFIAHTLIDGYWNYEGMKSAIATTIDTDQLLTAISVQFAHMLTFFSLAYGILLYRDIKK